MLKAGERSKGYQKNPTVIVQCPGEVISYFHLSLDCGNVTAVSRLMLLVQPMCAHAVGQLGREDCI